MSVEVELRGRRRRRDARPGATLLAVVRDAGTPLGQSCRARGVCRSCAVQVLEGGDRLDPPTPAEARWSLPHGSRLACQARIATDAPAGARVVLWHPGWGPADA